MVEKRLPSDVVKATLCYLGKGDRFPADMPKIYRTFYGISKEMKFHDLFKGFIFDDSQSYPFCSTIEFAFNRLQSSGLLECINPKLNEFQITQDLSSIDDEVETLFKDEGDVQLLKEIATVFKTRMKE